MSDEPREHRLKRLHMRSMRRGIKEMDLILSTYAGRHLVDMTDAQLDVYDAMLNENDQDLYRWVTGQETPPAHLSELIHAVSRTFQPEN
ncbi:succinate dehydrogenase assembly factor 2 [Tateyamaria omphalii]|uniref:succinate dehydrogenase assembly factor 2 n=1 Tax=Tateyamaria omphalii TaxID=299262 RepID=UPI00167C06A5|nr:succinate dehydrogenase assembly factor 2 [Tateyamaria omphalii]GGX50218.1 succinate dehydrogenase assembly factor 2 [Tateyamaria omphalii]